MASTHKSLRSSTANKRPTTAIADGQIALNTNVTSPGLFFKDSTGATVIKVGPVHVGATAPNASPAAGGSTGNSAGEVWLDNSLTPVGVKIWDGSAWVNATPAGSTTVQGLLELATNAETQAGSDAVRAVTPAGLQSKVSDSTSTTSSTTIASSTAVKAAYDLAAAAVPASGGIVTGNLEIGATGSLSFEGSTDDAFETTLAVVDPTADRTITFPDRTGTVITSADTGTVTSTMIADGTIVNADINASAAIGLSKLATGALPTGITVASANIVDGTIGNADISASAEIAVSKLADGAARQLLQTDAAGTGVEWTDNVDVPGTLDVTGATTLDSTLSVPLGSAGAPTVYFTGDTNTGIYSPGADQLALSTNGTQRATIDSSGRFLVGTSTARSDFFNTTTFVPSFQIEGTDFNSSMASVVCNSTTAAPYFLLGRSRGASTGSATAVASGDIAGYISFQAADGIDMVRAATIECNIDGTPGADDMPGRLVFSTTATGASSPTERMRIGADGILYKYGNSTTARILPQTDNAGYIGASGARWQAIYAVNGTIQTSDVREKTDIVDSPLGADFIRALRPVAYKWKIGGYTSTYDDEGNETITPNPGVRTHYGFIAQEVRQATGNIDFGGWLQEDLSDPESQQSLRLHEFISPVVKALQEALERIETLETRLAALEAN